jgi:hypothetical protein
LVITLFLFLTGIFNPAAIAASETQSIFSDVAKKVDFPVYYPTFIPEGFNHDAAKDTISEDAYSIYFTGPKGTISINSAGAGDIGVTENVKTSSVGDLTVSIGEQGDNTTVAWWSDSDRDYAIIATGVNIDDMQLIADSIVPVAGNLPDTGADGRWFALAFILIAIGLALIIFNPRPGTSR